MPESILPTPLAVMPESPLPPEVRFLAPDASEVTAALADADPGDPPDPAARIVELRSLRSKKVPCVVLLAALAILAGIALDCRAKIRDNPGAAAEKWRAAASPAAWIAGPTAAFLVLWAFAARCRTLLLFEPTRLRIYRKSPVRAWEKQAMSRTQARVAKHELILFGWSHGAHRAPLRLFDREGREVWIVAGGIDCCRWLSEFISRWADGDA